MENKRVIPIWISIVLTIALLLGMGLSAYFLTTIKDLPLWSIIAGIFDCVACLLALAYCLKGYNKNAALFFNLFCVVYCVSCIVPIYGDIITHTEITAKTALLITLHLVTYGCLFVFAVARDLGKNKSYCLSSTVLMCELINAVFGFSISMSFGLGMSSKTILAIVFVVMIYAKYKDKAIRGTK